MRLIVVFLLLMFAAGVFPAFADSLPTDTVRLQEVVVRAIQPPLQQRSSMPVQQLNAAQLERISGFSAAGALKNFSGLTIKDYGGTGGLKTVMIRSLGAGHTAVTLDGMPLTDAATGQIDLGKIPLSALSEITLFVGQSTELLQPARNFASAGVVALRRKYTQPAAGSPNTRLGVRTGSFGLFSPWVGMVAPLSSRTSAGLDLGYTQTHGEYPFTDPASGATLKRINSDVEILSGSFMLTHQLQEDAEISFSTGYYHSERGLPGAVILYNPHSSERLWDEDISAGLRFEKKPAAGPQLLSLAHYNRSRLRYRENDYAGQQSALTSTYLQHELYLSQAAVWSFSEPWQISLASDFTYNTLDADLHNFAYPRRQTWLTHLGAKYSKNRLQLQGGLLATLAHDRVQQGDAAGLRHAFTPSFSALYRITSHEPILRARLMYKNIFRLPTFNDLYFSRVGNPALNPEYARQWNLGLLGSFSKNNIIALSASADVFHNKVTDKIVAIPTQNLFVWSMQNIGEVDILGLEWQLQSNFRLAPQTTTGIRTGYTFQRARDITRETAPWYRHQIPYIPRESFSATTHIEHAAFSAGLSSLFTGHRYILPENTYENMLHSWWHHDAFAAWQFSTRNMQYILKLEVNNVFDRQYEVIRSFPMPGRAWYIHLEASF